MGLLDKIKWLEKETSVKVITEPVESKISNVLFGFQLILRISIYIIWSRRVQMIKTRKWRESIEKQMKNKDEKES